jgi:uncharacterized protein YcgI (DUF1989 family)
MRRSKRSRSNRATITMHRYIPPKSGAALVVKRGEILRVTDVEGQQACDFVAFNAHDHHDFFSAGKTRLNAWRVRISTGDRLYSNQNHVMFTIVEDTVGVHDLLLPACNSDLYEHFFGVGRRKGCLELLQHALEPYGIDPALIPDPFNLFTNTMISAERELVICEPASRAGDHIDLRAEMDCVVGLTACPEDLSDCNGRHCTAIDARLLSAAAQAHRVDVATQT